MSAEYYERLIARSQKMLSRWRGGDARLRQLTAHHPTLEIVITRGNEVENLMIACLEPEDIRSPSAWRNASIRIETVEMKNGEVGIIVIDDEADVAIKSGTFEIKENVRLR